MADNGKIALIYGAGGLVGSHLLDLLLKDDAFSKIIAAVRRPLGINDKKLTELYPDFNHLEKNPDELKADYVFCCLGTTLKTAGSKEAFRKVDFDYVVSAAKIAEKLKAECFSVISSMGADANSRIFYSRVKGEMEAALQDLNLANLVILRPSLLTGNRKESRPGEKIWEIILKIISPILLGKFKKYRAVSAGQVAAAMLQITKTTSGGVHISESDEISKK